VENRTFGEIAPGGSASMTRRLKVGNIRLLAALTGFDGGDALYPDAAEAHLAERLSHGVLANSLVAVVLGTRLQGPSAAHLAQELAFRAAIRAGDTLSTSVGWWSVIRPPAGCAWRAAAPTRTGWWSLRAMPI